MDEPKVISSKASPAQWTRKRKRLIALNVLAMIIIALGILAGVNYLATQYYFRHDCTSWGEYTLSEKTKNILKELDKPVTIYTIFVTPESEVLAQVQMKTDDLLEEYAGYSNKLIVKKLKPMVSPEVAEALKKKLNLTTVAPDDMIFVCEGRQKNINLRGIYTPEYEGPWQQRQSGIQSFHGEENITGAILSVTREKPITAYFTKGHNETEINDYSPEGYSLINEVVKRENIQTKQIGLARLKKIPEDCDVLIMAGPQGNVPLVEQDLINTYLEKGGKALFMIDPIVETGLDNLLKDWGVLLDNNVVLDPENCRTFLGIPNLVWVIGSDYGSPQPGYRHPITRKMTSDIPTTFVGARSLEPVKSPGAEFNIVTLISSAPSSWGETNLEWVLQGKIPKFTKSKDKKGPLSLAVAVTKKLKINPPEDEPLEARLVVFGDSEMIKNKYFDPRSRTGFCAADLFMNSLRWLTEQETLISIQPKKPKDTRIELNKSRSLILLLVSLVFLPLLGVILGITVWLIRRK